MNTHSTNKPIARNADVWIEFAWKFLCQCVQTIKELAYGIQNNAIPWITCCGIGVIECILITFHLDIWVAKKIDYYWLYPTRSYLYWPYCFFAVTSGFWGWAVYQVCLRIRLIRRLKEVFTNSSLKTATGRLPSFISNTALDCYTQKLKLAHVGIPKSQFEKAHDFLQSGLHIFIDEIKENRKSGTIDIIYSHYEMPEIIELSDIKDLTYFRFTVGNTRGGRVVEKLNDVPHMMVAGQSGWGKSTFLRQLITTFYVNNKHAQFTLIDLKGGLEFQLFENLKRAHVVPDLRSALKALEKFEQALKERMALLKENNCKDLDAYWAIPIAKRKATVEFKSKDLDRHIVVVDEAAEMFLAGDHASSQDIQKARRNLSQIARQGRAVGIHLIIATQRPDAKSLDPQVKANLIGVLCYAMANDASSITVLGNGRATDLPGDIKGRAIWKKNADMTEVQTPLLTVEEAIVLLDKEREVENKNSLPNTESQSPSSDTPSDKLKDQSVEFNLTTSKENKEVELSSAQLQTNNPVSTNLEKV